MAIDRRTLIKAFGAAVVAPPFLDAFACAKPGWLYAAAYRKGDGNYGAAIFDEAGAKRNRVMLPGRGHGLAVRPDGSRVVAFARRPGKFAVEFGTDRSSQPVWFSPPQGRHFYGHGVFASNGQILYAAENDIETGRGLVGLYDATDCFKPLGVLATGGIGPHDLDFMPDGHILVVANGGIRTHPDHGRQPLNLDTMAPSLAYLDSVTGDVIEQISLGPVMHKLSLRHLAVNQAGTVVVGCQYRGPRQDQPDLVVTHRRGEQAQTFALPDGVNRKLRDYVSSVSIDSSGQYAAITSSKGSVALIVDLASRKLVAAHELADVSGVASYTDVTGGFLMTTGTGTVRQAQLRTHQINGTHPDTFWDNHLLRVT